MPGPISDDVAMNLCLETAREFVANRRAQLAVPTQADVMAYLSHKGLITADQFARLRPLIAAMVAAELETGTGG